MKIIGKLFTILIVFLSFTFNTYSQDKIVYLDLDNVVTNTRAGKLILSELEKSKKAALLEFEKKKILFLIARLMLMLKLLIGKLIELVILKYHFHYHYIINHILDFYIHYLK